MKIPHVYKQATWRNTTNIDPNTGNIGIGFNLHDGEIVRLRLDMKSARHLVESVNYYQRSENSHSPRSSGMPNSPGSIMKKHQTRESQPVLPLLKNQNGALYIRTSKSCCLEKFLRSICLQCKGKHHNEIQ